MERRGVSPVVATVLLILIAVILAAIIFIWAKSFIGEKAEKDGEPVEAACARIVFEAEAIATENKIYLVNRGDVPIYGVEIRKKGLGSEINVGLFEGNQNTIANGENGEISLKMVNPGIVSGEELVIVPIILGEYSAGTKAYTCDVSEKSEEITVR